MSKFILSFLFSIFVVASFYQPLRAVEIISSGSDEYEVTKVLGSGCFGKVYAVRNTQNKLFALKMIEQFDFSVDHIYLSAQREYERGQMLKHSRIIKSYEFFAYEPKQSLCVVLEYVDGQTLTRAPVGTFSKKKSSRTARQLIDGLKHAAVLQLYHLDLHSDNVMITKNGNVKIIDLASFISLDEYLQFVNDYYDTIDSSEPLLLMGKNQIHDPKQMDFRIKQKLAQFCNQFPKLDQQKNKGLKAVANLDHEMHDAFMQEYLSTIKSRIFDILKLGKFKHQKLQSIQQTIERETDHFFETHRENLNIEQLPLIFDCWDKILRDTVK